ncbi:MAG: C39 family peptidase [Verrucomicrobiota bacterium]
MSDLPAPTRFYRRRWFLALAALTLCLLLAGIYFGARFWSDYNRPGTLEGSGGRYFFSRVALPVPFYRQNDERWGNDPLGPTTDTLGGTGCAVSSAAMVLSFYGIDTDPQRLNAFLSEQGGYTPQGWIYWEAAAELQPGRIRHAYEDLASHRLIDSNLSRGNPVIVKLRTPQGGMHFVVIAGKEGFDYLTCDPAVGPEKGLRPLKELNSRIEGLRFYERLTP